MARSLRTFLVTVAAALVLTGGAQAAGGNYIFAGGTAAEQTQVRSALNVSAFDWGIVRQQVTIHIGPLATTSYATPGHIWLDAKLVDSGRFAWGIAQHEYAHQVDFYVLTDANRAALAPLVGGTAWWGLNLAHGAQSGERFASSIAWAYWPSADNAMKPQGPKDEAGTSAPAAVRAALASMIGAPDTLVVRTLARAR